MAVEALLAPAQIFEDQTFCFRQTSIASWVANLWHSGHWSRAHLHLRYAQIHVHAPCPTKHSQCHGPHLHLRCYSGFAENTYCRHHDHPSLSLPHLHMMLLLALGLVRKSTAATTSRLVQVVVAQTTLARAWVFGAGRGRWEPIRVKVAGLTLARAGAPTRAARSGSAAAMHHHLHVHHHHHLLLHRHVEAWLAGSSSVEHGLASLARVECREGGRC